MDMDDAQACAWAAGIFTAMAARDLDATDPEEAALLDQLGALLQRDGMLWPGYTRRDAVLACVLLLHGGRPYELQALCTTRRRCHPGPTDGA